MVQVLAVLLAQEATADLPTVSREVTTPLGIARGRGIGRRCRDRADSSSRSGDGRGFDRASARAEVWHLIGLYRDESTLRPKEYYNKFPVSPRVTLALTGRPG